MKLQCRELITGCNFWWLKWKICHFPSTPYHYPVVVLSFRIATILGLTKQTVCIRFARHVTGCQFMSITRCPHEYIIVFSNHVRLIAFHQCKHDWVSPATVEIFCNAFLSNSRSGLEKSTHPMLMVQAMLSLLTVFHVWNENGLSKCKISLHSPSSFILYQLAEDIVQ